MKKSLIIIVALAISLTHCKKEDALNEDQPDYILFGHYYGKCIGEGCIEIFKLTETGLFEDLNDIYPDAQSSYSGKFIKLHDTIFNKVKNFNSHIPSNLLNESNGVIGMPDYADGGGLYFEYHKNGITQYWKIDQMTSTIPTYLHPFVQEINSTINKINN